MRNVRSYVFFYHDIFLVCLTKGKEFKSVFEYSRRNCLFSLLYNRVCLANEWFKRWLNFIYGSLVSSCIVRSSIIVMALNLFTANILKLDLLCSTSGFAGSYNNDTVCTRKIITCYCWTVGVILMYWLLSILRKAHSHEYLSLISNVSMKYLLWTFLTCISYSRPLRMWELLLKSSLYIKHKYLCYGF